MILFMFFSLLFVLFQLQYSCLFIGLCKNIVLVLNNDCKNIVMIFYHIVFYYCYKLFMFVHDFVTSSCLYCLTIVCMVLSQKYCFILVTILFVHSGPPFKPKLGIQAARMVVYITSKPVRSPHRLWQERMRSHGADVALTVLARV